MLDVLMTSSLDTSTISEVFSVILSVLLFDFNVSSFDTSMIYELFNLLSDMMLSSSTDSNTLSENSSLWIQSPGDIFPLTDQALISDYYYSQLDVLNVSMIDTVSVLDKRKKRKAQIMEMIDMIMLSDGRLAKKITDEFYIVM
jgi:hypothetical protein